MSEEEDSPAPPPFCIPIHASVESSQASHGLRHDDYKQYHAYCSRRLSRLRHAQPVRKDLVHSATYVADKKLRRHAYCPRSLGETSVHHENFLWVRLVQAERAWAHACELKALISQQSNLSFANQHEKSNSSPGKIRQHVLKKLKRARHLAGELQELAAKYGDQRTALEAKAYSGWMRGNHQLEVGDWKSACEEYASAISHCRTLSQSSEGQDRLELRDLFTARVNNVLVPLLRYCQYECREAGETPVELLDTEETPSSPAGSKKTTTTGGGAAIAFRGTQVAVENKSLRVILLKLDGILGPSIVEDDDRFVSLLSTYDDAITIVSSDLKKYQSMKAGPAVNAKRTEMESLLGYVQHAKLKLVMRRNEGMVDQLRKESPNAHAEIAHLYEALLQEARVVGTLPGAPPDSPEDEFVLQANANVLRLRAWRCYYAGLLYEESSKLPETLALWKQASLLASRASEEIAACEDMEYGDEYLEGLDQLGVYISGATCRVKAQVYLRKRGKSGGVAGSSSNRNLLLRLDEFGGSNVLVDVPPSTIPLPCKPTFFDVAWNHVGPVSTEELEKHIEEHKPKQSSGLLGWFSSN